MKRKVFMNVLLGLFGVLVAGGIIALVVPRAATWLDPRMQTVKVRSVYGDIFYVQPNSIAPPTEPDDVLLQFRIGWGESGYRIPRWEADDYPILALGDSYTEGRGAPEPWPDVLARVSGVPVRNKGFSGYGVQEYALTMTTHGVSLEPEVVIMAFFGGNDIAFARERPLIENEQWEMEFEPPVFSEDVDFPFPVQVVAGGQTYDMAFLYEYLWWMNVDASAIRDSINMAIIRENWREIADAAPQACKIIAYVPSKGEVYLPFLSYEDRRTLLNENEIYRPVSEPGAGIELVPEPGATINTLLSRRGNLQAFLAEEAEALGFHFVDLTPVFTQAAAQGAKLFYAYDTHWNQAGHDVAGEHLAEALAVCDEP